MKKESLGKRLSPFLNLGVITVLFVFFTNSIFAAPSIILKEGQVKYTLGRYLDYLEDPDGKLSIEDILNPQISLQFTASKRETPSFGYTDSTYWVRFTITNPLNKKIDLQLEHQQSFMNYVDFYSFGDGHTLNKKTSGRRSVVEKNKFKYRFHVFNLKMEPLSKSEFYLRFQNSGPMILPLYIWTPKEFRAKVNYGQTLLGIYYGIMGIMLLYNLFIFFSLRDKSYLYYGFFISMMIWYQLNADGLGYQYLWSDSKWMAQKAVTVAWNLTIFGYIVFSRSFLKTSDNTPKLDKILLLLSGLTLINAIFSQLGYMMLSFKIGGIVQTFGTLLLIIISLICINKKYRAAYFYFGAMMAVLFGAASTLLKNAGFLPDSILTAYGAHFGSAIEVVLLSLGLADRIRTIRREKYLIQQSAMKAQQEALENELTAIKKLKTAENRIGEIINNAIEGIFQFSFDRKLLFVNPSMAKLFGYTTAEEMIGLVDNAGELIENQQEYEQIYQSLTKGIDTIDFETQFIRKDQSRFLGIISIQGINDKSSQSVYAEGMILDISERKRREKAEQSQKVAEEANLAKSQFLAQMSHELRTPMQGILGYSKLGIENFKNLANNKVQDYFSQIHSSGTRLLVLLNDLLDLSKLESGKMDYDFQLVKLTYLVNIVLSEFATVIKEEGIDLVFEKPTFSDKTLIDAEKMVQVIRNLLSNAIKFSPSPGVIRIKIEKTDKDLEFFIIDNGIGVPEEELENIFDKFVQSKKKPTNNGGTGLGLAISQQIIEAHQGKIWAKNNSDGGSTFRFTIPIRPSEKPESL